MARYSIAALSALFLSLATAQRTVTAVTSDIQPTVTQTLTGPIQTNQACKQIADFVDESNLQYPSVQADLAYACLQSVPFDATAAASVIVSLKRMVQFQSTLTYLKAPPSSYPDEPVDILKGLDDINTKISAKFYKNEYDFEADIASLFQKAHDGHFGWDGMAYSGAFRWRRSRQISLISASRDGSPPKIWALHDFNKTDGSSFTPSAVAKIDGKDAVQFLQDESAHSTYHDPDTRFNAMFYGSAAETFGYFTSPKFYPGPMINVTFENGTTNTYMNNAVVLDTTAWKYITDGQSFYDTYISGGGGSKRVKKRDPDALPHNLQHPKDESLAKRSVPNAYPKPFVSHKASDVPLAGYFLPTAVGEIGVLMIQTFLTSSTTDSRAYQSVIQSYLTECARRGTKRIVIDVRTNGGGKILLGYDAFKQFFPKADPQLQSRYRGHPATEVLGQSISSYTTLTARNGDLFTSPYNYNAYLNKDLVAFKGWNDMYPPETHNNDKFTALLRYNLSDPLTTSSDRFSIGVTITGYGSRADPNANPPFDKDSIIILSDGICASTCSLFTELMVQQAGVKTIAVGGRPVNGPMQPVGGTKGSLVLKYKYLAQLGSTVAAGFAGSTTQLRNWTNFLPVSDFDINYNDASINFQDNIRKGQENDGIPTQFINDTAACRIWYSPTMYLNVTELWSKVAETAWGKDGQLDASKCVPGSTTTVEQQKGQGNGNGSPSNPSTPSGTGKPEKKKGAAAATRPSAEGTWIPLLVCIGVALTSMGFGASLI